MNSSEKECLMQKLKQRDYTSKEEILSIVKQIVQPQVNEALQQLIQKLRTIQVVQTYSEKIQSQKFEDKREQQRHEKERLRFELGSEYESSEQSNLMDDYDGQNKELSDNDDNNEDYENNFDNGGDNNCAEQIKEAEDEEENQISPQNRNRFFDHKLTQFNPIKYLGFALKEIIGQPVNQNQEEQQSQQEQQQEQQQQQQEQQEQQIFEFAEENGKDEKKNDVDNLSEIKSTAA